MVSRPIITKRKQHKRNEMKRKFLLLPNLIFFALTSLAQQGSDLWLDSVRTLSERNLREIVMQFHPLARQADLLVEKAKTDITIAKRMFDPLLSAKLGNKTFDGVEYYKNFQQELTIPTWFGVEVNAGIENLSGNRTNPEKTVGKTRYAGVKVPLAKNLMMDQRRAALQQAKIFREMSEAEKRTMLNDLLQDAMDAYWQWVQHYEVMRVMGDAVTVNQKRLDLVRIAYRLGDRPAMDTIEALTQLQGFQFMLNEATLHFNNSCLRLSTFLWNDKLQPVDLPTSVQPDSSWKQRGIDTSLPPMLEELLSQARQNHPELLQYDYKLTALGVEKKLKFQELLPSINFQYNQLGKGFDIFKSTTAPLFDNNYRYAVSFGIPLRFSQGRGEYRKAKLTIRETSLQRNHKTVILENKIRSYYNELLALRDQVLLQRQQYRNLRQLQRGEETKLFNGESSLFLVNSRENKALEALQKLVALETKYFKTLNSLYWAGGVLPGK
jgi:outer membrane protein TolC